MSDFKINSIATKQGQHGPVIAGVSTVNSTGCMKIPSGPTEMRGGRGTALTLGGYIDATTNIIDKLTIATTGDAVDFGDITAGRYEGAAVGSATRGILSGGAPSTFTIDYVTFSSGGGANDFGSLRLGRMPWSAGANDSVRGFIMGGQSSPTPAGIPPRLALIEFIIMATTGDSSDFGDLIRTSRRGTGCSSPTRAIHFTGRNPSTRTKDIQFFTMATKGNAVKFGEATDNRDSTAGGFSSSTRGVFGGGNSPDTASSNVIEFITIASEGNGTDFGDLTVARISGGGASSKTRGLFCGGYQYPGSVIQKNEVDFVTIATTGNATDFGDLTSNRRNMDACSDSNGGIGE